MKRICIWIVLLALLTGCTFRENPQEGTECGIPTVHTKETWPDETTLPWEPQTETSESTEPLTETIEPSTEPAAVGEDWKAIWLTQYDLWDVYLDDGNQRDQEDFTARMGGILDNICAQGFNTVILQVRPNADSMYPSEYYPMSKYVVGEYGREADYDPVTIIVSLAKDRDLAIHGWINPMRCMTTQDLEAVGEEYLIRQWYDDPLKNGTYIVNQGTYWYLNPAYSEVRDLIFCGAAELLERYNLDGLHMDDYFYPTTDASFDAEAYEEMSGGRDLEQFRRDNLNLLVSGLYDLTKASGEDRVYGVSPAGNIHTVYNTHYADVYTWCSREGYIDYICPQVYFGLEHQTFDFATVCNTWQDIITLDSVELIIGMSFEKALAQADNYAGSGKTEWAENQDVLKRCLEYTAELPKCRGVSVFCYQFFFDPVTGEAVDGTALERENFVPVLKIITWQEENG